MLICQTSRITAKIDHVTRLSLRPLARTTQDCTIRVNLPVGDRPTLEVKVEPWDQRLRVMLCEHDRIAELYVLRWDEVDHYKRLAGVPECTNRWRDIQDKYYTSNSNFELTTPLRVTFPDLRANDNFDLVFEITGLFVCEHFSRPQ